MTAATATKPGTAGPSPWDAPPVLDGPSFAPPRTARDEAHAIAVVRQTEAHRRAEARRRQQEAQHAYTEAVRHAEATQLRRQLTRVRHRRDQAQPLLRDAVVGGVAVATPLMLFASGNAVRKELRELTAVAAAIAGLVAAREWMHHQHDRRVEKLDAEAERLEGRLELRSIPQPPTHNTLDVP